MLNFARDLIGNLPKFRLSKAFFYALIAFLPIQTGKAYFSRESFYFGYHAFYNTYFFYLTDILIFGIIVAWLWENYNFSPIIHRIYTRFRHDRIYQLLAGFCLISAISLLVSRPPAGEAGETLIGFYGFARITGYLILFTYIRENIISREISRIFWLILAVFSFESIVGIAQYLSQNSLGLGLLGEEFLRPGLKGVAEFVSHGIANPLLYSIFPHLRPISDLTINIRAYGTLPHPNVLAGLLFFGLMANIFVLYKGKNRISREILAVFSLITITTGLVVTFSRLAWVISFLGILLFAFIVVGLRAKEQFLMKTGKLDHNTRLYRPERASFIVFILLISAAINLLAFGPQIKDRLVGVDLAGIEANDYSASESIDNRQVFNGIAWEIIKNNPILGVGVRNFVVSMDEYSGGLRPLPHLHQPVHNIYLLIAAESGIFALIVFLFLLYNIVPPVVEPAGSLRGKDPLLRYTLLIIFFGFLFWGLFDHFFWTIQEGSLAFWLVAGLLVARR